MYIQFPIKKIKWLLNLPCLYYDMNHPSTYGAYLSACVHYASITGRKSEDNIYMMPGIENEIAEIIQRIADEVVFNYLILE